MVQAFGLRVQVRFSVWGVDFGSRIQGLGFRIWGSRFRVRDLGFRVQRLGCRVLD